MQLSGSPKSNLNSIYSTTLQNTRFFVAYLEIRWASLVQYILINPPTQVRYQRLKEEIWRISTSEEKRVRQLLTEEDVSDRTPSQFPWHLRVLTGETQLQETSCEHSDFRDSLTQCKQFYTAKVACQLDNGFLSGQHRRSVAILTCSPRRKITSCRRDRHTVATTSGQTGAGTTHIKQPQPLCLFLQGYADITYSTLHSSMRLRVGKLQRQPTEATTCYHTQTGRRLIIVDRLQKH